MITTTINGNAIDYALAHPDSILIHVCNNRGVMGAGIALQIKQRVPSAYDKYMNQFVDPLSPDDCLGKVSYSDDLSVCNLTCQDGYGRGKKRYINYGYLVDCVQDLAYFINNTHKEINTVAMPMNMGSALAGGDWETVIELVAHQLKRTKIKNLVIVDYVA